jgi:GNAT superfamily N-acetyltransferase
MRAPMSKAASPLELEYVREPDVPERLDRELRELISGCFPQPRNAFFSERRYALEMPGHRYLLRDEQGRLVGHLAIHEKRLSVDTLELSVGGVAEVCVHESQRGRGHARRLLERAHEDLRARGVPFAVLFGEAELYISSGYLPLTAPIRRFDPETQRYETAPSRVALHRPLLGQAWPEGLIDLRGPMF